MDVSNKAHSTLLKLFLENENGLNLFLSTAKSKASITFFKLDIPEKEEHCFIGAFFIKDSWQSSDIVAKINEMAGFRQQGQSECHVLIGEVMLVAISYKYDHEPPCVSQPSLLLCHYYCRCNSLSNGPTFASTDARRIGWIRILHNIIGPRYFSGFRVNQHVLPPMQIMAGRFVELPQEIVMDIFALLVNPAFVSMDALRIDWIRILHNIIHPRYLSCFRVNKHVLPPVEIKAGRFVELPQEILMDIFARLEFPDLVRAGCVCTSWNSAYTSICSFEQYKCSQEPRLIYTSESAGEHVAFLYSLVEKRAYKLTLPELDIQRRHLIGSSQGWLVTADDRCEMHLVNPVTSEQISLPSVSTIEQVTPVLDEAGVTCMYRFSRHTAESIMGPTSTYSPSALRDHLFQKALLFYDTSSGSYFVVLIHHPFGQLSFARLGDEKWTWLPPHSLFDDCIYKNGILYAVTLRGIVITFDISTTVVTTKVIFDPGFSYYGAERVYIVEAPWGGLLQVWRPEILIRKLPLRNGRACATYEETSWHITIYNVCLESGELVEINGVDDHVLFLGQNQSLCSSAEEYSHLKPNHIYFTDDCKYVCNKHRRGYRLIIGRYNIQTKMMDEIVSPQLWSTCMTPLWIIPNPRKMMSEK